LNRREFLRLGAAAATATTWSRTGWAQSTYPDRVVKLIVPRPAGGVVDVIARQWGDKVSKTFGATYVENMGGGGGIIGAASAARAPADGYTLLFGTTSELVLNPILSPQSYDPVTSFEPIAIICESIAAIIVNPSVPAANLGELVAYARKNPGRLSYGSAGAGTVSNMAGELFKRVSGLSDITHIPYRGGNPAMTDLIAGNIPIMTPMMDQTIIAMHRQGQIRVLAVASERRLAAMPEIATAAEQGYPDLIARLFVGLFAPAGTPQPILAKVAAVTQQAMQDPDLQKSFANAGFVSVTSSDATSAARYLNAEIVRWKPLLEQTGLK
jgi:tripartite-type tricarboxylate transporter receptor subunit TctC